MSSLQDASCFVCGNDDLSVIIPTSCNNHFICTRLCLTALFERATNNEEHHPPSCPCVNGIFNINKFVPFLHWRTVCEYRNKMYSEYCMPKEDRTCCARPGCKTFSPPSMCRTIPGTGRKYVVCPDLDCPAWTCCECKGLITTEMAYQHICSPPSTLSSGEEQARLPTSTNWHTPTSQDLDDTLRVFVQAQEQYDQIIYHAPPPSPASVGLTAPHGGHTPTSPDLDDTLSVFQEIQEEPESIVSNVEPRSPTLVGSPLSHHAESHTHEDPDETYSPIFQAVSPSPTLYGPPDLDYEYSPLSHDFRHMLIGGDGVTPILERIELLHNLDDCLIRLHMSKPSLYYFLEDGVNRILENEQRYNLTFEEHRVIYMALCEHEDRWSEEVEDDDSVYQDRRSEIEEEASVHEGRQSEAFEDNHSVYEMRHELYRIHSEVQDEEHLYSDLEAELTAMRQQMQHELLADEARLASAVDQSSCASIECTSPALQDIDTTSKQKTDNTSPTTNTTPPQFERDHASIFELFSNVQIHRVEFAHQPFPPESDFEIRDGRWVVEIGSQSDEFGGVHFIEERQVHHDDGQPDDDYLDIENIPVIEGIDPFAAQFEEIDNQIRLLQEHVAWGVNVTSNDDPSDDDWSSEDGYDSSDEDDGDASDNEDSLSGEDSFDDEDSSDEEDPSSDEDSSDSSDDENSSDHSESSDDPCSSSEDTPDSDCSSDDDDDDCRRSLSPEAQLVLQYMVRIFPPSEEVMACVPLSDAYLHAYFAFIREHRHILAQDCTEFRAMRALRSFGHWRETGELILGEAIDGIVCRADTLSEDGNGEDQEGFDIQPDEHFNTEQDDGYDTKYEDSSGDDDVDDAQQSSEQEPHEADNENLSPQERISASSDAPTPDSLQMVNKALVFFNPLNGQPISLNDFDTFLDDWLDFMDLYEDTLAADTTPQRAARAIEAFNQWRLTRRLPGANNSEAEASLQEEKNEEDLDPASEGETDLGENSSKYEGTPGDLNTGQEILSEDHQSPSNNNINTGADMISEYKSPNINDPDGSGSDHISTTFVPVMHRRIRQIISSFPPSEELMATMPASSTHWHEFFDYIRQHRARLVTYTGRRAIIRAYDAFIEFINNRDRASNITRTNEDRHIDRLQAPRFSTSMMYTPFLDSLDRLTGRRDLGVVEYRTRFRLSLLFADNQEWGVDPHTVEHIVPIRSIDVVKGLE